MTVVRLKYVHKFPGRNGKTRYYLRKPGCKQAKLPDPSSPDFYSEYQRLLHGGAEKIIVGSSVDGSLIDLITKWRQSHKYRSIKASTRQVYDRILNRIAGMECAQGAVKYMSSQNVRFIMRQHEVNSPTTANRMLSLLSMLLDYAVDLGWRDTNPAYGVKRLKISSQGLHSWSDYEINKYQEFWATGTKQRLAFVLLLYTGQRRSDVVRMGPSDVSGGFIKVTQQKTGARLDIPIHNALAQEIQAWPSNGAETFLTTASGKPFSVNGFYNNFAEWCQRAGLPKGCSPHGLRKAAARLLAEAGCTPHQIAAVTGHKTLSEVERYTRAVEQKRLAQEAITKIG
ncbi:site-specific integrase [Acetobacter okinawensis]|uniref:site-specific integrase n=1 Tax=Acetobacter okinawensis TaxID=1076594 RepID=UPI00209DBEBE|nr:tyrosine-type recombinase/integrase [Acetobacter okinawensis]